MYEPHPPCHNIAKQLSGPHVYKGFPYMDDHTKQLRGQTQPLRTRNSHTHSVTILENNCQGHMLIRVSPRWIMAQNHFLSRHNHYVHPTATPTVERSTSDPMFIWVSPLLVYLHPQYLHIVHKTLTLYTQNHLVEQHHCWIRFNHCVILT